jgi:tetratricopeptide (TPR) repeat protein
VLQSKADEPTRESAYYNKGVALIRQKKLQESIDAWKNALRLDPQMIRRNHDTTSRARSGVIVEYQSYFAFHPLIRRGLKAPIHCCIPRDCCKQRVASLYRRERHVTSGIDLKINHHGS